MTWAADVVLVGGATGRIGTAVCARVLAGGGRVAAAVRRSWQVAPLQQLLGRDRVLVGAVGSGDAEAAAGFVKGARDALGPLTAFVGAAGRWQARAAGLEPGGDLAELLAANLIANATLARAVLPSLRRGRRGVLLFPCADDDALAAGSATFAASAAALREFVRALARDLDGSGVHATTLPIGAAAVADAAQVAAAVEAVIAAARAQQALSRSPG